VGTGKFVNIKKNRKPKQSLVGAETRVSNRAQVTSELLA